MEELDDLGAAVAGAHDHRVELVLGNEGFHADAGNGRVAGERNHVVTVTAEHHGVDVAGRDVEFFGDEPAETGAVENAGHAHDFVLGETGLGGNEVGHDVERIAHDDDNGVGGVLLDVFSHAADDLGVLGEKVIAAHAGLTGQSAGDDNDIGTFVVGRIVRAFDEAVEAFNTGRLHQVEGLALRHAFNDVVQNDVAEILFNQALRGGRAYETRTNNCNFHSKCSPVRYNVRDKRD